MKHQHYRMPQASSEVDNMTACHPRHRANAKLFQADQAFCRVEPAANARWPTEEQRLMAVPMGWETLEELADEM